MVGKEARSLMLVIPQVFLSRVKPPPFGLLWLGVLGKVTENSPSLVVFFDVILEQLLEESKKAT